MLLLLLFHLTDEGECAEDRYNEGDEEVYGITASDENGEAFVII